MPCRDYQEDWGGTSPSQQEKIDQLAKMLCACCTKLEMQGDSLPNGNTREWWKRHQESDKQAEAERKAEKRLKELRLKALGKLTEEELEALGLK